MRKKILLVTALVIMVAGCKQIERGNEADSNTTIYKSKDKTHEKDNTFDFVIEDENKTTIPVVKNPKEKSYSYIPKGKELTQEMAYKFLNMATFGATPQTAKELRDKGVVAWVNEQLNMPYNPKTEGTLKPTLERAYFIRPEVFYGKNVEDVLKPDFEAPYGIANYDVYMKYHSMAAVTEGMLYDKAQLRQKVAYALSQTIIASQSVDKFFEYNMFALNYYYDILLKYSFANYSDILYNVSLSPAMSYFLTYNGSRKEYKKKDGTTVTPDENYGRELMQLFTIGLYKLNMDGMNIPNGMKFEETYTQKDVNEMSKVFTGFTTYGARKFGDISLRGNMIHPLKCEQDYHDSQEKHILGETIPAGQTCQEDVKSAIAILMHHDNMAPFISKKLIKRLTKSNPKAAYIERVANVFNDNGKGVKGDLNAVVKAILLDQDIWDDIKKGYGTKIKEPWVAFMQTLRLFDVKPYDKVYDVYNADKNTSTKHIDNKLNKIFFKYYWYNLFTQAPLFSPTVFNFYDDTYVPNSDEFRSYGYTAPEISIQTTNQMIVTSNMYNIVFKVLDRQTNAFYYKKSSIDYYGSYIGYGITVSTKQIYNKVLDAFGGKIENIPYATENGAKEAQKKIATIVVDEVSMMMLGHKLSDGKREILITTLSDPKKYGRTKKDSHGFTHNTINLVIELIATSDEYMVN